MINGFPEPDEANDGTPLLVFGQFVLMQGALWQFVGRSKDGLDQFYNRELKKTIPLHFSQIAEAWKREEFKILPLEGKSPTPSILRNVQIPLDCYTVEQQHLMRIGLHYVQKFDADFICKKVSKNRDSVEPWLKKLHEEDPPKEAASPAEYLSKYQVVRAYDKWIAGGRCITALAHGNQFGTHTSDLDDIRHIIEAAIEQFHVPYPDLELKDLCKLINAEIVKAQDDGTVPKFKEKFVKTPDGKRVKTPDGKWKVQLEPYHPSPCKQTILNHIDRLNGHEKRRIREGIDKANREHGPRGRKLRPELPFDEWQCDHALLPVHAKVTVRNKHGQVEEVSMGPVWNTGVVDVASTYILSVVLGIDGPSTSRSMEALKFGMCPKGDFFRSIDGLKSHYDPTNIPFLLFVDNGLDYHGKDLDAMMDKMNIENGFAAAYRGDHKETIEKINRLINAHWLKFPGAVREQPERGTRPQKREVIPLPIEQIREETWRFVMEYNTTRRKDLGNRSPLEVMESGTAKIEAARKSGRPLPLRSIMTKSKHDIDRAFSLRAEATVRENGVRYKYLEWSGSGFADRSGHRVIIHMPPGNVQDAWIFDIEDRTWFTGLGVWPLYMMGLPLSEHLRILDRVKGHEASTNTDAAGKRRPLDWRHYMSDDCEPLRRLFALAGKSFELDPSKKRNDKLWSSPRDVGRSIDFSILSTRAVAVDLLEGRISSGAGKLINVSKGADGVIDLVPVPKPRTTVFDVSWEPAEEDDRIDMTSDPLRRNDEGTPT